MRGIATTLAFVVPMLSVAGCASSHHAGRAHEHLAHCATGNLILGHGAPVVPMTGEHAVMFTLTNRGSLRCTVRGYPQVTLFDAHGQALPFRYTDGGGAYVTSRKPETVVLAPGASGFVLVAKYRCDQRIAPDAARIRLALPAGHNQISSGASKSGSSARRVCRTAAAAGMTRDSLSRFPPSNGPSRLPAACADRPGPEGTADWRRYAGSPVGSSPTCPQPPRGSSRRR